MRESESKRNSWEKIQLYSEQEVVQQICVNSKIVLSITEDLPVVTYKRIYQLIPLKLECLSRFKPNELWRTKICNLQQNSGKNFFVIQFRFNVIYFLLKCTLYKLRIWQPYLHKPTSWRGGHFSHCYKLIQRFRVTFLFTGLYTTGYYGTITDVLFSS